MHHTLAQAAIVFSAGAIAACSEPAKQQSAKRAGSEAPATEVSDALPFRVPQESEIKDSITLASIRRGRALIHATRDSLPQFASSALNCANCHFSDGTVADAMPLVGAYSRFPQYRARSGKVDLLEDRINDCFVRSLSGKPLDPKSNEMHDIVTYIAFLSRGYPPGKEMQGQSVPKLDPLVGDTARGRQIFSTICAACHGADGNGGFPTAQSPAGPPLWGPRSYNVGAGMARIRTAAAFIHHLMPRDRPGTLTPQQAFDVATYVDTRPRPDLRGKERDWPHGDPPPDVAYPTLAAKKK